MNNNNHNNNYNGGFPTWSGTDTSGFPTWWNNTDAIDTTTVTTSDNITFTASTDGTYSGNILSLTANTTWDFYNNYEIWPKGVQDPLTEFKYSPKWHILLGYKIQMQLMWD